MERLVAGFMAGLLVSTLYEKQLKRWLEFERTKEEIRSLPAR